MTVADLRVATGAIPSGDTVRSVAFDLLRQMEMTTIFGNPGSTELPMLRDFPGDFRYVLGLNEAVVVGMADGFAQATGRPALVNLHSSAGVGHAMGNLFTAYRNATPLVVTAGQQARSILPFDPFLYAERATELPRPFVKWAAEPARAADVPRALVRAWHIARQPPCGPTFVSIPIDDWDRPGEAVTIGRIGRLLRPAADVLAEAASLIGTARRPVIVAGGDVATPAARAALQMLAERLGAPVRVAPMAARNPFAEDHGLFRGFLPASREAIIAALGDADLVIVAGAPIFTFHVEEAGPFLPPGAAAILLTDDPNVAARAPLGLAVVGDLADALGTLAAAVPPAAPCSPPASRTAPAAERLTDALLMARLHALRPKGIAVVEEAPSSRKAMHDHLPILAGEEFHTCASGGLGHGLPAAVGVALGGARPVLCIVGDGSAMYAVQALWSAAQEGADVRFVVVNNGGYVALDQFAALFGMAAVGTALPALDFVALAEGQGVPAERVSTADALDGALDTLFAGRGPRLLEVLTADGGARP